MNYASWRKCDFQVHTPRDPNWHGSRPVGEGEPVQGSGSVATVEDVDNERRQWSENLIEQCATKGLQAVALTDHHEMVMVTHVQEAIEARKRADPKFDIWLFPGMELTAKGGTQCLILFDTDVAEEWRVQAQAALGIALAEVDANAAKASKVTQLDYSYPDIAETLDHVPGLRGKYIVLPNVSQGGSHTVLKDGAHKDFSRMPYVGGYLDTGQTIDTLSAKNQTRLSGKDSTWSQKHVYPLPTSDSRSADFRTLGANNTWIKIAEPTAEAIRQAFLGHQSRIRIKQPKLPSFAVIKAEIQDSSILETTDLFLSPEFNAVIGGRGSGKSTFLEYVAFALGRSSYEMPREHYSGTERMRDLISDTLISRSGRISLDVQLDNAAFRIVRGPDDGYQPRITYQDKSTQTVSIQHLRRLFPAVVYSQGELADIGRRGAKEMHLSNLLQFVDPEYKRKDDQLESDIKSAKEAVKSAIRAVVENWNLRSTLRKQRTEREALTQRAGALQRTLPSLSEDDQAIVAHFDTANEFNSKLAQASKHSDQMLQRLEAVDMELRNERDLSTELEGTAQFVQRCYRELYAAFGSGISALREDVAAKRDALGVAESKWKAEFQQAVTKRNDVLKQLSDQRTVTEQIIKLREEITKHTNQIREIEEKRRIQGDPAKQLEAALGRLEQFNNERDQRTQEWAATIESLSSGKIKARVTLAADTGEIRDAVEEIGAKTGSHEMTRNKELSQAFAHASVSDVVGQLRSECLDLLQWRQVGSAFGEQRPKCEQLMKVLGATERIQTMVTNLMDTKRVEAIATAVAKPRIDLHYFDGGQAISFEKASDGQRAAALLFMLLEQPGGALIVDQPEGDLDNRIIAELTDKIHQAKEKRQLVFASHNANLVVNGSAELVGHLDVNPTGARQVVCAGAIDRPEVCSVITSTMEGGEKAFKDRQQKYGY